MKLLAKQHHLRLCAVLSLLCLAATDLSLAQTGGHRRESARGRGAVHATETTYTNPVFAIDFPDPTVLRAPDGWYYAYATQTIKDGRQINIQVARTRDLMHWTHLGDALPVRPRWAQTDPPKFWAPHVSRARNTYYLYYSADADTRTGLCLAVATAQRPQGPFTDSGRPLQCGPSFINIDPMQFDDPQTGKRLLYWGSGFQPLKAQELAPDRISFMPGSRPVDLIAPHKTEDLSDYQRLVEGAWVVYRNGYYYIFYSGDNCCGDKAHYAVMVARSRNALGPFETLAEVTGQPTSAILARNAEWLAPGHNSIVTDAAGQDWIFYHAINANNRWLKDEISGDRHDLRVLLMERLVYRNGWPRVERGSPATKPQPAPRTR